MQVWRICRKKHAAFDGEGARAAGGRWNRRGTAVVYTSATLSLAVLEYFVNLPVAAAPADLVAIPAELPGHIPVTSLDGTALPRGWRKYPAPDALADLGSRWVDEGKTAVLAVPSVIVPQEKNYLLNPAHPRFREITPGKPEPLSLDSRMWKR